MNKGYFACIIALSFMATGCGISRSTARIPNVGPSVTEEMMDVVEACPPTTAPAILECPTQMPVPPQSAEVRTAKISSSNLTLRAGPSIAHAALGSYPINTEVTILGKAPGGSWVVVSTPGGRLGWMYTIYLGVEIEDPLTEVAEIEATDSWVIEGKVVDDAGQPVENVGVSVALGGPVDYADFSDPGGRFALFAPNSQPGPWMVSIEGVGCLSRLVDSDCQLVSHILRNPSQVYMQGQSQPLEFVYEATSMRLAGSVLDGSGNPYGGAGIFATRSDGAYITGKADSTGRFDIPITAGTWTIRATRGALMSIAIPESGDFGELTLVGSPN